MPRPKVGRPSGNGGTPDLSIDVPAGATIEDIVAFVIDRAAMGEVDIVHETHIRFGLLTRGQQSGPRRWIVLGLLLAIVLLAGFLLWSSLL